MQRVLAAWALLALVQPARAGEARPHGAFFSARATGMAGTQIGLADDPSAAWYNPAGLALLEDDVASLGATALQHDSLVADRFLGAPIHVVVNTAYSPTAISAHVFGPGRLALAALSPGDRGFRADQVIRTALAGSDVAGGYSTRDRTDNPYYLGLAYGQPVGRTLDVGVGVYYVYRYFREVRSDLREYSAPRADGSIAEQTTYDLSGVGHGGLLMAGLSWLPGGPDGQLRFGLTARWGFDVLTTSRVQQERFVGRPSAGEPGSIAYERVGAPSGVVQISAAPSPSLGAGVGWRLNDRVRVGADVVLTGLAPLLEPGGGSLPTTPTPNVSLGAEAQVAPSLRLQAGLYTNRSSIAVIEGPLRPDYWAEYGVGFGGTLSGAHTSAAAAVRLALISARGTVALEPGDPLEAIAPLGYRASLVFGGSFNY